MDDKKFIIPKTKYRNEFPNKDFQIKELQQELDNLIKNAIDFVPENEGVITIGTKNTVDGALFFVKDNGIGIGKQEQKHLFMKFYQVDTSVTRKHGGTGLGLVICKGIVEGLGGKIWVESEIGSGATFKFLIPNKMIMN